MNAELSKALESNAGLAVYLTTTTTRQVRADILALVAPGAKSLRDEFAMAALTGIKANDDLLKRIMDITRGDSSVKQQDFIARMAYIDADAMLAARSKQGEGVC